MVFFAGAVCAGALPALAQVVVNQPPPAAPQVVVNAPPPAAPQVVVNEPAPAAQVVVAPAATAVAPEVFFTNHNRIIYTGIAMFGIAYGTAIITGAVVNDTCAANACDYSFGGRDWLYAPLLGPFIAMGDIQGSGGGRAIVRALLFFDGAAQLTGAAMAIVGLVLDNTPHRAPVAQRSIQVLPFASGTSTGLVAFGRF